jgi:murein DD-endopeptidase MepM/ murein hydrolase activator NlpD
LKEHTIIFVPHARAQFRKWRFSSMQAGVFLGSLALLTSCGLAAMFALFNSTVDRDQLAQLKTENESLREVNRGFDDSVRELEGRVEDYQQRIHKLAIVAGITELSPNGEAGIGGSEPPAEAGGLQHDLLHLQTRLQRMGQSMEVLKDELARDNQWVSTTPAIVPTKGIFTSKFGYRSDPFTKRRAFHQGIDIVANRGKEILATGDGIVTQAGRARGLGNAVTISHGFGIKTRYGHMSKVEVHVGQEVRRGELIGRVGSSGRSTGNHVHYEVHVDGKPQNPLAYILDSFDS